MNSHLRRAAAACLFSTVPGWILLPDVALAQSAGPIRHADAFEELFDEPAPRGDLGKADRIPKKEDFSASGKVGGSTPSRPNQKRFKRKVTATAPAAASQEPAPPATVNHPTSATPVEDEAVSQTAALQSRPFSAKKPQSYSAPPQNHSSPSSSNGDPTTSDVERELQELYRKNGREMPDMRMDDFQTPQSQGAPPRVPGMRHGPASTSDPGAQEPRIKPSKPNFMERVFGFGRAKKPAPAAPQPSRPTSQAVAPRNSGITPSRQPQQYPPFRPSSPVTTPAPTSVPRVQSVPAVREPAPLGGPSSQSPGIQPPEALPATQAPQRLPGLQPRESMLLDESELGGDDESLDLQQDEPQPEPQVATPKAAPPTAPAGSPYTGLTITPNETERSLARGEELPRPTVNPVERPSAPAVPAAPNSFAEAPVVEPAQPKLPVLEPDHEDSDLFPQPAAGAGARSNADDFLELADDDDDDDEEFGDKPGSEDPLKLPELDSPAPERPKPAASEKSANRAPEKAVERPAAAPAAPAKLADVPLKPAAEKAVEKPAEKPAPSPPESLKGLKGFCPVILKDERRLVEARTQYKLEYRGKSYMFSSQEARMTFEANPTKYVPVEEGRDVVRLAGGNRGELDGTLEHAAWYRGRLYLFSSEETRREFVEAPRRFMRND